MEELGHAQNISHHTVVGHEDHAHTHTMSGFSQSGAGDEALSAPAREAARVLRISGHPRLPMPVARIVSVLLILAVSAACRTAGRFADPSPGQEPSAAPVTVTPLPDMTATPTVVPAPSEVVNVQPPDPDLADWFNRRPAMLVGRFATTDTSGYDVSYDRLSKRPPLDDRVSQRLTDTYTYLGLADVGHVASVSRLVVRGRPLAFGRPYFNSFDSSYWDASLVGPGAGEEVSSDILRDVLFQVDEVLADATNAVAAGDEIEFTVRGGQVVVTITDRSAAGGDDHPLEPGIYAIASNPELDLVVAEEVVVFLDHVKLYGLYADGGERFGYTFRLMPPHHLYYRWQIQDGRVSTERLRDELTLSQLRALLSTDIFASAVGPTPDETIHSLDPHP